MAAQFMGQSAYQSQRNLVRILFSDLQAFLDSKSGEPNAIKVLETLKENGLLNLFYSDTKTITLTFSAQEYPILFMRIINESLQSMGYSYYLTRHIRQDSDGIKWTVGISTQHLVDPVLLSKQIQARGAKIQNVIREGEWEWHYQIDTHDAKPKVEPYGLNTTIPLGKPIQPYWVNVSDASKMRLRAHAADRWFPSIVFFDATLHIIEEIRLEDARATLHVSIPENAIYAKIEDRFSLDNIKRGLHLYLESR
jgi:hypothetical protein